MENGLGNGSGLGGDSLLAIRGNGWQCRILGRLVPRTRNR